MKKLKFCNSNLSRSYLGNFVTKIGMYEQARNLILCDNRADEDFVADNVEDKNIEKIQVGNKLFLLCPMGTPLL